ncbi:MAG: hypothetical protein A2Z21_07795 [Candidatus Fraserbacteria bacterium RBG_16_55_9]|uniref:Protease PrsW n=1 Tax=Fraserbacteria sp. (strain RBG_16_55_9) TaxID=1817864 RepID=A0A1F5UZX4_FRAXR|nr:MAG: hypothetical protein A2Z21_07795 [Candidatus Fraserbacteria bacterium RBG_16_55_9]
MQLMALWILVLAFAPAVFWLLYFYRRDRLEPEPRWLIVKTFLLGMLSAIPAAVGEALISWVGVFVLVVAIGPAIEEYCKYFVVSRSVYRSEEFDEPMDGIIYAIAAALGFASVENVGYLFTVQQIDPSALGLTFWARALLSVPGHALFSSMWGYSLGWGLLIQDPRERESFIRKGLWLAIALHGSFNLLAWLAQDFGLIAAGLLLVLVSLAWRVVHQRIASALERSPNHIPTEGAPNDSLEP